MKAQMGQEAELSRVLARSKEVIADMALSLPDLLEADLFSEYQSLCKRHTQKAPDEFVADLLGHYAIQSLILELHISYKGQELFHFGLHLLPLHFLNPSFECNRIERQYRKPAEEGLDLPPGMTFIQRWQWEKDSPFVISMVVLKPLRRMCANLLDFELLPIVLSYYPNLAKYRKQHVLNLSAILHQTLSKIIRPAIATGVPVTISHFHFQEMKIYLEITGEQQTKDFIQEIQDVFHKNLKQKDFVIKLSPVSYLVLSPGATTRIMKERFRHIFFMIRSLILEYKLDIYTVHQLPVDIHEIAQRLKL